MEHCTTLSCHILPGYSALRQCCSAARTSTSRTPADTGIVSGIVYNYIAKKEQIKKQPRLGWRSFSQFSSGLGEKSTVIPTYVASHSLSCLTCLALSELILKITCQINRINFPGQDPILLSKDAERSWPEGRQVRWKHRVWRGGHSVNSLGDAASSLVSTVNGCS